MAFLSISGGICPFNAKYAGIDDTFERYVDNWDSRAESFALRLNACENAYFESKTGYTVSCNCVPVGVKLWIDVESDVLSSASFPRTIKSPCSLVDLVHGQSMLYNPDLTLTLMDQ